MQLVVIEFAFPLLLAVSSGGTPTTVGLAVMLSFHLFITSCFPMGVPIEWLSLLDRPGRAHWILLLLVVGLAVGALSAIPGVFDGV